MSMPNKATLYRSTHTERPSAAKRGYDGRWRKYRVWFFAQPQNALCRLCKSNHKIVAATEIDHIVAVYGPDDPHFYEPTNHQPLCKSCHSRKTVVEDGGFGDRG